MAECNVLGTLHRNGPLISLTVSLLPGLPPYGVIAKAFPSEWGARGAEGVVVRFKSGEADWVGNFAPGFAGVTFAVLHPNGSDALVAAEGDLWSVNASLQSASRIFSAVVDALEVPGPRGWIFNMQGLALARSCRARFAYTPVVVGRDR